MGSGLAASKSWHAAVKILAVQPASPLHGLEGLKNMKTAILPGIYDSDFADEDLYVETEDAQTMSRRLAPGGGLSCRRQRSGGGARFVAFGGTARGKR